MLPTINMFWNSGPLGEVHVACIRSFMRQGHHVRLHCYASPEDAPQGVELFDASRLMPVEELISNSITGSVALGSDRYRYRLIEAGMGIYCDCDMYCLHPIQLSEYIIGQEDKDTFNGAILYYPTGSEMSKMLLNATSGKYVIPPHLKPIKKKAAVLRKNLGFPKSVEKQGWGVWGPKLITHCVKSLGLEPKTSPIDRYYPLHYNHTQLLFEDGLSLRDIVTPRTQAVHLCHKALPKQPVTPNRPMWEILNA